MIETVLPSGLAVRFDAVTTDDFLDAQERAAEFVGGTASQMNQAAYQVKINRRTSVELIAKSLRAVAGPFPIKLVEEEQEVDGQTVKVKAIDPDATLDGVPEGAWKPVNYAMLLTKDEPLSLPKLLADPRDFQAVVRSLDASMAPQKTIAVFSGKVRRLSR